MAAVAFGDETRRRLVEELRAGPRSVGELVGVAGVSQPAVSQHLRVLRDAGLVTCTPAGNRRVYQLDPRGIDSLRQYMETFWGGVLDSYAGEYRVTDRKRRA